MLLKGEIPGPAPILSQVVTNLETGPTGIPPRERLCNV